MFGYTRGMRGNAGTRGENERKVGKTVNHIVGPQQEKMFEPTRGMRGDAGTRGGKPAKNGDSRWMAWG
jgi:hypothetical protein